jgi:hypothetical protein
VTLPGAPDVVLVADGLLRIAGASIASAPTSPTEPARITIAYENGGAGATLLATWTLDGQPFRSLRVILTRGGGERVITSLPPPGGWPPGEHRIVLSDGSSQVAEVAFHMS